MTVARTRRMLNSRHAFAFGLIFALAAAPAFAQTEAACKQEYVAKKTAGKTGGQSEAGYVKACLAAKKSAPDPVGSSEGSDDVGSHSNGQSASDVAKKSQNPVPGGEGGSEAASRDGAG